MPDRQATHRFLSCELDLAGRELRRDGRPERLEPKVFDLLVYLLQNRDRVVTKSEIQERIWPDVLVTEASLDRTIMKARRAVGDDARRQAVIRTIPRRGYRFVALLASESPRPFDPLRIEPEGLSEVHFVQSGAAHIAWRTLGTGPPDLVMVPGFVSHLDMRYRVGPVARFDAALAESARLITLDKRGVGLSDRLESPPTLEEMVEDILAVMDAAAARQVVLLGTSESGPACAVVAARHPERVRGLVIYGSFAKGARSIDYPWLPPAQAQARWREEIIAHWGGPTSIELFAPAQSHDADFREGWARYLRAAATPSSMRAILELFAQIDVRDVLPGIRVPTLVIHRRGDRLIHYEAGRDFAERIPGARFSLHEGDAHWWFIGDAGAILREVTAFVRDCT